MHVSGSPMEGWPKSLWSTTPWPFTSQGGRVSGGHIDGQKIAFHEQKEHEAESWKQGLNSHPDPSAIVLRGLHRPTDLHSTGAQHTLGAQ